jgi:peptidylprolyl isomerase
MSRPLRALLPLAAALALAAAGCGSDSSTDSSARAAKTATPATPAEAVDRIAQGIGPKLADRPRIPAPQGTPPGELVKKDIVRGTGRKVGPGDIVSVQYVGASWSNGQEFDASWDRGQAFRFSVPGQVIPGWNEGVLGMRRGGRRLLVIPPAKGYGSSGTPDGAIAPGETLVFVIDLQQIN